MGDLGGGIYYPMLERFFIPDTEPQIPAVRSHNASKDPEMWPIHPWMNRLPPLVE